MKVVNTIKKKMRLSSMKLLFFSIASVFVFFSCDIIDDPVRDGTVGGGGEEGEVEKRVLVEKFTGHRCNNCPSADAQAMILKDTYGSRAIFVSYHSSTFGAPANNYPDEWRTPIGNELFDYFRIIATPRGMVNRLNYSPTASQHLFSHGEWNSQISQELEKEPLFDLQIDALWSSNRLSDVTITLTPLVNYNEELIVNLFLTESGIIAPQLNGSARIEEYEHKNMFRASYTGSFGESFGSDFNVNQALEKELSLNISSDFVAENCKLVAFIHKADNYEVIQAAEVDLVP